MNPQSVMAAVRLRHRAPGHLRFDLPASLCRADIAAYLEQGLRQLEGVRRVRVYRRARKLSVFYADTVCGVADVARKLARLIELLVAHDWVTPAGRPRRPGLLQRLREARPIGRLKARYREWQARARLFGTVAKAQWQHNPALRVLGDDPEKAVLAFINDAVTFYLIKVHWHLIINKWLKQPIRFRYEWATVFYLVFLLVRSRKK
ncbi:MAG: hypothetical protein Kow0096_09140 [Thiohalomonadaceae bacterium]